MKKCYKRKGATFRQASPNSTQLIQVDERVYGVTLLNGIPNSVEDLTEIVKGNNGNESV